MKKFKLVSFLVLFNVFMLTFSITTFAVQTSQTAPMTITGSVSATLLTMTVPANGTVSFSIDQTGTFSSSPFNIKNDSNGAVWLAIGTGGFQNTGTTKFTDVKPTQYTASQWAALSGSQAKQIALGVSAVSPTNTTIWNTVSSNPIYVTDVASNTVSLGSINPKQTASLQLVSNHANLFDQAYTGLQYTITWIFGLNNPSSK